MSGVISGADVRGPPDSPSGFLDIRVLVWEDIRSRTILALVCFCQGDKHPDNAVVADLPRPAFAADNPLGGRSGYPPDSGQLGTGHAPGAVADRETDIVWHESPIAAPGGRVAVPLRGNWERDREA
jgi:hypothetical protein